MNLVLAPDRRRTKAEEALEAAFRRIDAELPDLDRETAFARFAAQGLPHRRVEAYHFTDLRSMLASAPEPAARPSLDAARAALGADVFAAVKPARAVFVDGWFVADLSDLAGLGDGVSVATLAATMASDGAVRGLGARVAPGTAAETDPLVSLVSAFFSDGLVLRVADGATMARPLEIRHVSTGVSASAFVRHLVEVGEGASATVLESHESPEGSVVHAHTLVEMTVAAKAKVTWVDRQRESHDGARFSTLAVAIGDHAALDHTVATLGAKIARTQVFATLGAHADLQTRGATLAKGRTHADATLVVEHVGPGATSRELYKSAVDDEATSVFQGRITVQPAAQQTDGRMGAHAVLLSDRAEAKAKPELEIFADDVACAHGATVAEIDETLKFYLMSRGIPADETERLLIHAFLGEVTDAISDEGVRTAIEGEIDGWIDARGNRP
ncbi:Fe-S cluster assembly protein SufD [Pinisolibacter sp.]|uniref:Fe-S cluster assembly protein SufD n=1 Tax=Pinisolibacter sp. TaxID=2172024 RepID=UPI002FDD3CDC